MVGFERLVLNLFVDGVGNAWNQTVPHVQKFKNPLFGRFRSLSLMPIIFLFVGFGQKD